MTELYLYQTLHLFNHRIRLLEEHIRMLNEASMRCFGVGYAPNSGQLAARILAKADAAGLPDGVSGFVQLKLLPDGTELLAGVDVSLYAGYALRSVEPRAVTLQYALPDDAPTSARKASAQLARQLAEQQGAAAAVRCDHTGVCYTADDAPLFAVCGHTVFTSPARPSVERSLGIDAVCAAGLELLKTPIERTLLPTFDELFYVDHRGITSLSACDGQPYMDLIAARVARAMEGLFCQS